MRRGAHYFFLIVWRRNSAFWSSVSTTSCSARCLACSSLSLSAAASIRAFNSLILSSLSVDFAIFASRP